MIEDVLRAMLLENEDISTLISNRMFVLQAPQGVQLPYVLYTVVDINALYTANCVDDDVLIQYSVFSETYTEARTIANSIRAELENFTGVIENIKVLSIQFGGIGVNERDEKARIAHLSYDFKILLN